MNIRKHAWKDNIQIYISQRWVILVNLVDLFVGIFSKVDSTQDTSIVKYIFMNIFHWMKANIVDSGFTIIFNQLTNTSFEHTHFQCAIIIVVKVIEFEISQFELSRRWYFQLLQQQQQQI